MFQIEKVSGSEFEFKLFVLYSYPMRSAFAFVSGLKYGKKWYSDPNLSISDPNPSLLLPLPQLAQAAAASRAGCHCTSPTTASCRPPPCAGESRELHQHAGGAIELPTTAWARAASSANAGARKIGRLVGEWGRSKVGKIILCSFFSICQRKATSNATSTSEAHVTRLGFQMERLTKFMNPVWLEFWLISMIWIWILIYLFYSD